MNEVVDSISDHAITAFILLIILVWLSVAVGVQLAGLLGPRLPRPVTAIMDPTGTAAARARVPATDY